MTATTISPGQNLNSHFTVPTGQKKIRIGIIGAENPNTVGYEKLFNKDQRFPGVEENSELI